MNIYLSNALRFVFFTFIQVLVLNNLEFGAGIYVMVYPLFIFLLPTQWNTVIQMFIAFAIGISIDALSNTFGLHASAAVLFAFIKPLFLRYNKNEDGSNDIFVLLENGNRWFIVTFGVMLIGHHFWFFLIESFKLNEILLILKKVVLSIPFSMALAILLKYFIMSRKLRS